MLEITQETINNTTYFSTENRGINYTLHFNGDEWMLHSQRKSLGKMNVGSFKFFSTLESLENKLKAFKGISKLI